jgi:bacterioferritin (cytochrome b1)
MKQLAEHNKTKLIDLLCERLAFEREGVHLYDSILSKLDATPGGGSIGAFRDELQTFRDQEKEHEEWLEKQIRDLGGDTNVKTEMATLVERESQGIDQVVTTDDLLPHVMHAMLTAELVDNSGWELLIELADDADDKEARAEFRKRLHEEEDHLMFARTAMLAFARKDVLGYERRIGG